LCIEVALKVELYSAMAIPNPVRSTITLPLRADQMRSFSSRATLLHVLSKILSWFRRRKNLAALTLSGRTVNYGAAFSVALWLAAKSIRMRINANWTRGLKDASGVRSLGSEYLDGESEDEEGNDSSSSDDLHNRFPKNRCDKEVIASEWSMKSMNEVSAYGPPDDDERWALAQCGAFASLGEEILGFLVERANLLTLRPGELVFERGGRRDAFLVVHSGEVTVSFRKLARNDMGDAASLSTYTLSGGHVAVGLLFVLAGIDEELPSKANCAVAQDDEDCRFHSSTGRVGAAGAKVVSLPTSALQEAFDKFPVAMRTLAQLLCARLTLVVGETLSEHFGLDKELLLRSSAPALGVGQSENILDIKPAQMFAKALGCDTSMISVTMTLETASIVERRAGEFALPPHQRASHILILLEGQLQAEFIKGTPVEVASSLALQSVSPLLPMSSVEAAPQMLSPGGMIGELSFFIGRPSPLIYRCVSKCRFAALPRDSMSRLLDLQPRQCCLRLMRFVADKSATWLHRVDAALDWIYLQGGRRLFQCGDPMQGFYVVLSGRLVLLEEQQKKHAVEGGGEDSPSKDSPSNKTRWRVVNNLQRGHLCGELDCLHGFPTYTQTVRAGRDSEVCRISPSLLQLLAVDFPGAMLHFAKKIAQQRQAPQKDIHRVQVPVTIAVVPADSSVNVHETCVRLAASLNQLGKCLHVSPHSDLIEGKHGQSVDGRRLARVLGELEERCRWLVYEAEPTVTRWTRRCLRQADLILVVVRFDGLSRGAVPPSPVEYYVEEVVRRGGCKVDRQLLLLHDAAPEHEGQPMTKLLKMRTGSVNAMLCVAGGMSKALAPAQSVEDLQRPGWRGLVVDRIGRDLFGINAGSNRLRSTRHYLSNRPWAKRWHHVRVGEAGDWARCARLVVGQGIGLCLGGGGARGNIHFGVIKAMEELDIPIDCISGCSFGALVGSMYAMTAGDSGSLSSIVDKVMGSMFSKRAMFMDMTFPRTAIFTGRFLNFVLQQVFARRRCEDMLLPFVCTSTDILNFEAKLHREGPLWRIVRASMSLVGFVPPLPHQETRAEDGKVCSSLLVDGGYTNQYPIEALRQLGAGTVICVQACPEYTPVSTDYGDRVKGGAIALLRLFGIKWRWYKGPDPPTQAEIQERLMFLPDVMKGSASRNSDFFIKPPIADFGLLDFQRYKEIEGVGYESALPQLRDWLHDSDTDAACKVRRIVQQDKGAEVPDVASHKALMIHSEYGGRLGYSRCKQAVRKIDSAPAGALFAAGAPFSDTEADYQ